MHGKMGAAMVWLAVGAWIVGCGGRTAFEDEDAGDGLIDGGGQDAQIPMDAGTDAAPDAEPDAEPDAAPDAAPDAEPDVDAGPPPPPPVRLRILNTRYVRDGDFEELRVFAVREADPNPLLEVWALEESSGTFSLHCEGGPAGGVSFLTSDLPLDQRRLLVRRLGRTRQLMDFDCQPVGEPVEDVRQTVTYTRDGRARTILVWTTDDDLMRMDPLTAEVTPIPSGEVQAWRADLANDVVWTVEEEALLDGGVGTRTLVRRDAETGAELARYGQDVSSSFFTRTRADEVAFMDGNTLYRVVDGMEIEVDDDACAPRYLGDTLLRYSPCGEGRLVLEDLLAEVPVVQEVDTGVTRYRTGQWSSTDQFLAYEKGDALWYATPPFDSPTLVASDVGFVRHFRFGRLGLIVDDPMPDTLMVWDDGDMIPVADAVEANVRSTSPNYGLIVDYDGETGRFLTAHDDGPDADFTTMEVATGVPRAGFGIHTFNFSPRESFLSYLHDFDSEAQVGTLELALPDWSAGQVHRQPIDDHVTEGYRQVTQPERAMVYAVYDGTVAELRFEPVTVIP